MPPSPAPAWTPTLRPYRGAIAPPHRLPISGMFRQRVLFRLLLVEVHAPARSFVQDRVAVFQRVRAGEDFARRVVECERFLDAEIVDIQVEVDRRRVADRAE